MKSTNNQQEFSPKFYARIGGFIYLIIIVAGLCGEMLIRTKLMVSGDAAATFQNIQASQFLWRIGIAGDLLMHIGDVFLMWIFYRLLRPVNKNLALLILLFNLVQTSVLVANKLNMLEPLFLLGDAEYLKAFSLQQLQSISYLSIKAHGFGFGNGLIFFGFVCLFEGYLIFKSGFLPKFIGILMQIAGLCYLINSFSLILAPDFASSLFPAILLPAFIAELSFCLWLIVKGVNVEKWKQLNQMS